MATLNYYNKTQETYERVTSFFVLLMLAAVLLLFWGLPYILNLHT
jgi:hypothetical protein